MDRRFGFIHDKLDIKILVLFILGRLPGAVSPEKLAELSLFDEGISYFDFAECVADLVRTGHITDENGSYTITEKGRLNGSITESSLPFSVRIKAERLAAEAASELTRDSLITASHSPGSGGEYTVSLSLSDGKSSLLKMDIMAGGEDDAKTIEESFRRNAEKLYTEIIELLLKKE